jgi:hypothetical protein
LKGWQRRIALEREFRLSGSTKASLLNFVFAPAQSSGNPATCGHSDLIKRAAAELASFFFSSLRAQKRKEMRLKFENQFPFVITNHLRRHSAIAAISRAQTST